MFTQLRIQNFKAWKDTGNIRLAPLTVFFGPNSSGKTSLLQFFLLLKQTMESPDRKQALNLGGSHSYIDFGGWSEMVFGGDVSKGVHFGFWWRVPEVPESEGSKRDFFDGALMAFNAEIGSTSTAPIGVREFRYTVDRGARRGPWEPRDYGMRHKSGAQYTFFGAPGRVAELSPPRRFYGFSEEVRGSTLEDLEFQMERQLASMHYLGPVREAFERRYTWSGEEPAEVGLYGENTVAALLAAQGRPLQPAGKREPLSFGMILADWLVRMGLLESFEAKLIVPEERLYRVLARTPRSSRQVNLADVGFGVSQVLPVLVQLLYAEPHTTLMFEQPEIHLHPKVQSELADLFIETIQMRQDGKPRGTQCLVESHSEHFLRRIQRRIAEGTLTPDQTALYFCKPGPDGSIIEELKLDEYGNISNWPENFFGDEVGDLAAMTEAAMKRQLGSEGE